MGTIQSGIGLVSGINTQQLIDSLILLQRTQVNRLEERAAIFQATQTGLSTLEANLVSITTSLNALGDIANFNAFEVSNSDPTQIEVDETSNASAGTYRFQAVQKASTHSLLSKGYANSDEQTIGTGTVTVSTGGQLHQPTLLDVLNDGAGVRRGVVRVTDRSGSSSDVDLSNAHSVDDVLDAINNDADISVVASTEDGRIVLTDTSGSTSSNLSVIDLNGDSAAADLGIDKSVAADVLDGNDVYQVTADFTLDQINDGNGLRLLQGGTDIRITLTDDSEIDINLDGSASINDVVNKINNDENNGGKVTAALVDGYLDLTDTSGGGGTSLFSIEDINDSSVVRQLGLDVTAAGTSISGRRLAAGINSVLLRNLRGGQGIDQLGQITLTDRAGVSATLDLSAAESLDEVLIAINAAQSGGGTKLQISARLSDSTTGIVIEDTSGQTTSNLIVGDVGAGTLATQLGIAVDAAQDSVSSGSLKHRFVNTATSIANYAPDGTGIEAGSIQITDSAGNQATIDISTAVKNIGDVMQRINAASDISVQAELNETGDGFVLIDEAGGAGTLAVSEAGGTTAEDLRLLGDSVVGLDGKQRIDSRFAAVITLDSTSTLDDLIEGINGAVGFAKASVFDDGSTFNSKRLLLDASATGGDNQLVIDIEGLDLGLTTLSEGKDALLRVGPTVETGFLISSSTNRFSNAVTGVDVTVLEESSQIAEVTLSRDSSKVKQTIQKFVDSYNSFINAAADLTEFDAEANRRAILQGDNTVLRVETRLGNLVNKTFLSSSDSVRTLIDIGVRTGVGGKLVFNEAIFEATYASDPDGVAKFFTETTDGFADIAGTVIDSFTDPFTGTFTLEKNALQESVDSLQSRIVQLDEILVGRRERLLQEFINMETILGQLASQQQALGTISQLNVNPVGTGIF